VILGIGLVTLSHSQQMLLLAFYTIIGIFILEVLFYSGSNSLKFFSAIFFGVLVIATDLICAGILLTWEGIQLEDFQTQSNGRFFGICSVEHNANIDAENHRNVCKMA